MTRLEDIKNGASITGVMASQTVEVISVEWIGDHPSVRHGESRQRRQGKPALVKLVEDWY